MQPALITALLLLTLILPLAVVLWPGLKPDKPGLIALLAVIGAAALGRTNHWAAPGAAHVPLVVASIALIPALAIARSFGRVDMIAVVFHKDFGMQGASIGGLKNEITTAIPSAVLIVVATWGLGGQWNAQVAVPLTVAAVLLAINPFARHALARMRFGPVTSVLPDRLATPRLVADHARLPDLVIIYLEGTDRRFADTSIYGQTYRELAEFAAEGLSFTKVGQIAGTGWSLAGMVASQSGVPVAPRGLHFAKKTEDVAAFMPQVQFFGDILAGKGYASHYVVGGETGFGGIQAMYATHQITNMTGFQELKSLHPATTFEAARAGWLVDDQLVLKTAREVCRDLSVGEKPFALIVETIGPHGPKGILSRRWTTTGKTGSTNDIAHAVTCSVTEVMEFIRDIRAAQPARGRELRVVLLSDHLNHTPGLPTAGTDFQGYNSVIFWRDAARKGDVIDRPGSMIDVFPSLLEWLGWAEVPVAAGLGRSLLSAPQTLVEEFGVPVVNAMIVGDARLSKLLWGQAPRLAETAATT
ncbi:sulfatase-like hydrolase/transferase [Tabrizicola sp.]|uniref:sulfatase-like hydrolase/transferase n=1 Tax=Tabrizicola sp. TaxID=2005166 RepID=UPI00286A4D93|nr:sulfatase-like hydrolase/transferase [Tabrizicola sp.]